MKTRIKKRGERVVGGVLAVALAGALVATNMNSLAVLASTGSDGWYYTDFNSFEEEQAYAKQYSIEMQAESIVLLKNNGVLPLSKAKNVTLFGNSSYYHVVGKNSGDMDRTGYTMLPDALESAGYNVNPMVRKIYDVEGPKYTSKYGGLSNPLRIEVPVSLFGNVEGSFSLYGDAAITTISREGNEDVDIPTSNVETHSDKTEHALMLDDNERAMLSYMKENFSKVIVLVNCASTMDLTELEDDPDVDAIVWIGAPGMYGMDAVAQVLNGTVNPSGRTVDIYPADLTKNPTYYNSIDNYETLYVDENSTELSVQYEEDIYVGYKWYETAAKEGVLKTISAYDAEEDTYTGADEYYNRSTGVLYPFGYGLSYTKFEQEFVTDSFAIPENATIDTFVDVKVKVTNTGSVSGKEVVQLYINSPYYEGEVEKAEVSLVSFAKTGNLQPGQSETVTLSVRVGDVASFDYQGVSTHSGATGYQGFVVDAGNYELRLQKNSHEEIDSIAFTVEDGITLDNDNDVANNTPLSNGDDYDTLLVMEEEKNTMTLLSRSDFVATFPTAPAKDPVQYSDKLTALFGETTNEYSNYYALSSDDETDPWYVASVDSAWTQGAGERTDGKTAIRLVDLKGIDYTDLNTPVVVNGVEYTSGKAAWTAYMNQLTWAEMVGVCTRGSYGTDAIQAIGKPETFDEDGPEKFNGGTYFPCPTNQAATWNVDLVYLHGVLAAQECMYLGFTGWYAPAFNIHRTPFCGRNRSYYSEDGVMSGIIAAATVQGAESNGVYCFAKHLALNEQETSRSNLVTWASEQAIREIYLKPFEYSLKVGDHFGGARAVMTAMNRVGAIGCCGNYALLTGILRNEWGFKGLTVSDSYKDGWPKANMMQRAGCDIPLGTYSGQNVIAGEWDDQIGVYYTDENGAKVASPTQWAVIRDSATRILWVTASSLAFKNELDNTLFADQFDGQVVALNAGVSVTYPLAVDTEAYGTDVINYQIVDGALPAGLSIDNTGNIVGISSQTGSYTVTIRQMGAGWVASDATLTFVVSPLINSSEGWTAVANEEFNTVLSQDTYVLAEGDGIKEIGAIGYLSYSLLTPVSGLTLSSDGTLSGTPTEAGTYEIIVRITYTITEKYFEKLTTQQPQAPSGGWCRQSSEVTVDTTYVLTVEEAGSGEQAIVKSIVGTEINADGELVVTYNDGTTRNLGVVVGADGKDGVDGKDGADGSGCGSAIDAMNAVCMAAIALAGVAAGILIRKNKKNDNE